MTDKLDNIKNLWNESKNDAGNQFTDTDEVVERAEKKKKSAIKMHFINILILVIVLIGISTFFKYVTTFNQLTSHIGTGLMQGSLILRILIELYSIFLSTKLDMSKTALKSNDASLKFYQFRKRIHGNTTLIIVLLYTIGFYMLTPEFSLYFSLPIMVLIDVSYILGAVIFTMQIRKGIRKEMSYLNEILKIQKDFTEQ